MRIITLEVPDGVMCVGAFINYKTKKQIQEGSSHFSTTNFLLDAENCSGARVGEDGDICYQIRLDRRQP